MSLDPMCCIADGGDRSGRGTDTVAVRSASQVPPIQTSCRGGHGAGDAAIQAWFWSRALGFLWGNELPTRKTPMSINKLEKSSDSF